MFKNFLKDLCEAESLIDVGNQGIATQSSYSKWSKPDDPQRAVSGEVFDDFAFHTEKELNPWWQIEWNEPVKLQHIIINNRKRKPLDRRAINIRVLIVNDKDECICIYTGKSIFGGLPYSLPLILSLQNEYVIKKIRIILDSYDYFHLSGIHTLKKVSLQEKEGQLIFFANRTDGFGERLRAILHAMVLAKYHKGQFYFDWPAFNNWSGSKIPLHDAHSVFEIEETFDKDFIDSHRRDPKKLRTIKLDDIKEKIDYKNLVEYDSILVNQGSMSFHEAFQNIKFSNKLESIKIDVDYIFSKFDKDVKVTAIHLRMGDIVYGINRFRDLFYYKVLPVYILNTLIDKLKKDGYQIILFGQDKDFCASIAEKYNIMYSESLVFHKDYDVLQKAFFDIVLMSKCDQVIAMHSGFAELATFIGKSRKITKYQDYLSEIEIYSSFDVVKEYNPPFDSLNPILTSFTISHFLHEFETKIELSKRISLIQECIELDAVNPYYKLIFAKYLYEAELIQDADVLVLCELDKKQDFNLDWLTRDKDWRGKTTLSKHIDEFQKAAEKGSLVAGLLVLVNQYMMKQAPNKTYFESLLNNANSDALGRAELEAKMKEVFH